MGLYGTKSMDDLKLRLLSSVYGKIEQVLIVLPGIQTGASEEECLEIIQTFEKDRGVHIFFQEKPGVSIRVTSKSYRSFDIEKKSLMVVHNNARPVFRMRANLNIESLLTRWKRELDDLNRGKEVYYRRWAQDPFLVLASRYQQVLLESYYSSCLTDHFLALQIAESTDLNLFIKPSRLIIEGGNILCMENVAFIGSELIEKNVKAHACSPEEILELFRSSLGVEEVIEIGISQKLDAARKQPLFHIDLFVTLGGRSKDSANDLVFIGSPVLTEELLDASHLDQEVQKSEIEPTDIERWHLVDQCFSSNYRLVRLPIFFREGVCYSWNNALVEIYGEEKRVFLPSYQTMKDTELLNPTFEVLENEVERRFQEEGFEVVWIRSGKFFRIIASHGGSLHCATKVLKRSRKGDMANEV